MMKKKMIIEGMACPNCVKTVAKALNSIDGVSAEVDLASKTAICDLSKDIADEQLQQAVVAADFDVVSIEKI